MYYYQEKHVEGIQEWYFDLILHQYPLVLDWTTRDWIHGCPFFLLSR